MSRSQKKHNKNFSINRQMRLISNSLTSIKDSANPVLVCRAIVAGATIFSVLNAHFWHTDWLGVLLGLTFIVSLGIEVFLSYKGRNTEPKNIFSAIDKGWKNVLMGAIAIITLVVIILSIAAHLGWELPIVVGYALLRVVYWLMIRYVPTWQATLGNLPINSNLVDFVYLVALGLTLLLRLKWPTIMTLNFILSVIPFGILTAGKFRGYFRPSKILWLALMLTVGNPAIIGISIVLFGLMIYSERGKIPEWNIPENKTDKKCIIAQFRPFSRYIPGLPSIRRKIQFFKTEGNVINMAEIVLLAGENIQNLSSCCDPEVRANPFTRIFLGTGSVVVKYHEDGKVKELKFALPYKIARNAARNKISVLIDRTCEWQGVTRLGHA